MTQVKNILVVGGGIGGQSVAIALKKLDTSPKSLNYTKNSMFMVLVLFNKPMPFAL
jgi:flavin-dependent dehydrogenase